MKVAFATLGCKVNQYETQVLENLFFKLNFEIVSCFSISDIYILNSCTVTARSDAKMRQLCCRFKRLNPAAVLVLTGCFAQAFKSSLELFCNFDVVVGNANKFELPNLVKQFLKNRRKIVAIGSYRLGESFPKLTIDKFQHKFRAFVKIEDGCNRNCAYCIIPRARGYIKSKPLNLLELEAKNLANNFYKEIVLVGINLSSYGFDCNRKFNLVDAVDVVSKVENLKRVRLSSLEPDLLTENDIIRLSRNSKFCPSFHLALQSGSDSVLQRMGRKYNVKMYFDLVKCIFTHFKNPSITTDVMVGFPQESEEEFLQTLKFVEKVGFLRVHIFPFSARPGTLAAKMLGQISQFDKKRRAKKAKKFVQFVSETFLKTQVGRILQVLFEIEKDKGFFVGHSENYCLVKVKSEVSLVGQIKFVKIVGLENDYCVGEVTVV